MVPYGAAAMAEIDSIRLRLKARAGEADLDKAWKEEWSREADRVAAYGDKADAEGFAITAGNQYMRAGNYYYSAERFIPPGEEKLAIYRKALRCYQGAMTAAASRHRARRGAVRKGPDACPPISSRAAATARRPTVVLFDGMDNAKEMSVIFAGLDLAKRGINVLAIDGPGQSEPLRLRNIPSRHDYEAAGIPAYDFVAARPDVDPKRVAVMGYQLRRLSRAAHLRVRQALRRLRRRSARCTGACTTSSPATASPIRPAQSSSTFQWRWVVGAPDNADGLEMAKKFTLEGVAEKVECPFLMLHGENDRVVPARRGAQALRSARLEEQDAAHLHRGGRRRRALPGRPPPARRRLHRRLAAEEHVSRARTKNSDEPLSGQE